MSVTGTVGVEMRLGGGDARDITPLIDEFLWTESLIDGGFSWSIRLRTDYWKEWWDLVLGRERTTTQFRLKQQEAGVESSTDWKEAIVDWSQTAYSPEPTLHAAVHGADRRLNLLQRARTRTFKQSAASDVVRKIGQEHGLAVDDVASTRGRWDRWQLREDDWSFLRRLARESSTTDGRGDTFLYMEESSLRLVVVQFQAASVRRYDAASVENRLDRYAVQYHGRQIDRLGGATLRGVGFDFAKKAGINFEMDSQAASVYPAMSKRVPRNQADGVRIVPLCDDSSDSVEASTRSIWGGLGPRYFSLKLNTRPDFTLKPNAVIEIVASDDPNRASVVQGRYALLEVQHRYLDGAANTTAVAYRREAWEGDDQPTGAAADSGRTRDGYRGGAPSPPRTVITAQVLT